MFLVDIVYVIMLSVIIDHNTSDEFNKFLKVDGIKHSYTPPYYPATNGVAENYVNTF